MAETIIDHLREKVVTIPDAEFVKCTESEWLTYRALDAITDRIAGGLAALGVGKGDRVAIMSSNRLELVELYFACAKIGAIHVMLNFWLRGELLRHQLADCGAIMFIADGDGYRSAVEVLDNTDVRHIVLMDGTVEARAGFSSFAELRASSAPVPRVQVGPLDPASILYTSGTTGPAKGCVQLHGYSVRSAEAFLAHGWYQAGERIFTPLVMYHTGGQIVLSSALVCGGSMCLETEFHTSNFMRRAAEERADVVFGAGAMGMAIVAQPETSDDWRHRFRFASFAGMSQDAQKEFERRFATPVYADLYGMTECQPVTLAKVGGLRQPGSCGQPTPYFDVRLFDDQDREVGIDEIGEIVVRPKVPAAMFAGYWGRPQETLDSFRNLWFHTGDLATSDPNGILTFVDRKGDSLRRRGENISTSDVENAACAHPSITEAGVCAVAAEAALGEDDKELKLSVVQGGGASLEPAELFDFLRERLPYYAVPRYIDVRDSLPRNEHDGKIRRGILRAEGVTPDMWDFTQLGLVIKREERRRR